MEGVEVSPDGTYAWVVDRAGLQILSGDAYLNGFVTAMMLQFADLIRGGNLITDRQRDLLNIRVTDLFRVAAPVGSMHSFWDPMMDIQAFLDGRSTLIKKTAREWIEYADELLAKKRGGAT